MHAAADNPEPGKFSAATGRELLEIEHLHDLGLASGEELERAQGEHEEAYDADRRFHEGSTAAPSRPPSIAQKPPDLARPKSGGAAPATPMREARKSEHAISLGNKAFGLRAAFHEGAKLLDLIREPKLSYTAVAKQASHTLSVFTGAMFPDVALGASSGTPDPHGLGAALEDLRKATEQFETRMKDAKSSHNGAAMASLDEQSEKLSSSKSWSPEHVADFAKRLDAAASSFCDSLRDRLEDCAKRATDPADKEGFTKLAESASGLWQGLHKSRVAEKTGGDDHKRSAAAGELLGALGSIGLSLLRTTPDTEGKTSERRAAGEPAGDVAQANVNGTSSGSVTTSTSSSDLAQSLVDSAFSNLPRDSQELRKGPATGGVTPQEAGETVRKDSTTPSKGKVADPFEKPPRPPQPKRSDTFVTAPESINDDVKTSLGKGSNVEKG
jgi:hypothetical protein